MVGGGRRIAPCPPPPQEIHWSKAFRAYLLEAKDPAQGPGDDQAAGSPEDPCAPAGPEGWRAARRGDPDG